MNSVSRSNFVSSLSPSLNILPREKLYLMSSSSFLRVFLKTSSILEFSLLFFPQNYLFDHFWCNFYIENLLHLFDVFLVFISIETFWKSDLLSIDYILKMPITLKYWISFSILLLLWWKCRYFIIYNKHSVCTKYWFFFMRNW